jgi:hypothetical protein
MDLRRQPWMRILSPGEATAYCDDGGADEDMGIVIP